MKYELQVTLENEASVPPYAAGFDRLTWFSPAPGLREKMEVLIANGGLSRYVEHDDRVIQNEHNKVSCTIFNTRDSAQEMLDIIMLSPVVIWAEIIERPDL